jgi:hypothetical protein
MRPIGFSTGALAYADFRRALLMMQGQEVQAIELSALRQAELCPLLEALDTLDVGCFSHVSIHAPSQFDHTGEAMAWERLRAQLFRRWPVVVHPDALTDWTRWREFGPLLCVENMDKRKPIGRTARELDGIFRRVPDASFCFDIGHARQCDPTMTEAFLILREFGPRLRQVHVSEVNTRSKHDPLSYASVVAFQEVAHLIPSHVPLILETPLNIDRLSAEIAMVRKALPAYPQTIVA